MCVARAGTRNLSRALTHSWHRRQRWDDTALVRHPPVVGMVRLLLLRVRHRAEAHPPAINNSTHAIYSLYLHRVHLSLLHPDVVPQHNLTTPNVQQVNCLQLMWHAIVLQSFAEVGSQATHTYIAHTHIIQCCGHKTKGKCSRFAEAANWLIQLLTCRWIA